MTRSFPFSKSAGTPLVSTATVRTPLVSKTVSGSFPSRFPFPVHGVETGNEVRAWLEATCRERRSHLRSARMSNAEITLTVTAAEEGGFVATWDDPRGGGIATQGEDLRDLQDMVRDAVEGYFQAAGVVPPRTVRLHFVEDPALAIA